MHWNTSAYDRLVLPSKTKELVRALVTVRTSQRGVKQGLGLAGKRQDIISGKGNGLIMLFHGGPGTGKTLTAGKPTLLPLSTLICLLSFREVNWPELLVCTENLAKTLLPSVAEIAEMPLYRVTCGDIGTDAAAVERYLNNVLTLAKTWNYSKSQLLFKRELLKGVVLLLDEADVFLEERSMSDLKRNSLVSGKKPTQLARSSWLKRLCLVFLRILEYYDGILMLTSNRVETFDEAFKSRIQVTVHYEALTRSSRRRIWQNFLNMMHEDKESVDFDEMRDHLDELAGLEMNGREIRNALTTARQLAIYKKEKLAWERLERAITVSTDFNEYLQRVHGHTDEQRVKEEGIR